MHRTTTLRCEPPPPTRDLLDSVAEYRRTARAILRGDHTHDARREAILRLYERAKAEAYPPLFVGVIVAEIGWEADRHDTGAFAGPDPMASRHRRLRATGYETCPECWTPLSDKADWDRWRDLRDAAIRETRTREGAA